nr:MAG TPA: hypothetical protein [Caudoviricetes sp.]
MVSVYISFYIQMLQGHRVSEEVKHMNGQKLRELHG